MLFVVFGALVVVCWCLLFFCLLFVVWCVCVFACVLDVVRGSLCGVGCLCGFVRCVWLFACCAINGVGCLLPVFVVRCLTCVVVCRLLFVVCSELFGVGRLVCANCCLLCGLCNGWLLVVAV